MSPKDLSSVQPILSPRPSSDGQETAVSTLRLFCNLKLALKGFEPEKKVRRSAAEKGLAKRGSTGLGAKRQPILSPRPFLDGQETAVLRCGIFVP